MSKIYQPKGLLLPYQVRLEQDNHPVQVFVKSRRIGGTLWAAIRAVTAAMFPLADGGYNVVYACHRFDTAYDFMEEVTRVAKLFNLCCRGKLIFNPRDGGGFQRKMVRFANGNTVQIVPANPEALRGKGRGRVIYILDEFAQMPDARKSFEAAQAALRRFGRVIVISTHFGEDTFFSELVTEIESGKRRSDKYSLHKVTIIDACREGYYKKTCSMFRQPWSPELDEAYIKSALEEDGADEEYLCIPARVGSNYFYKDKVEGCMVPLWRPLRVSLTHEFMGLSEESRRGQIDNWFDQEVTPIIRTNYLLSDSYYGQDFARSPTGDLSVIALVKVAEDLVRESPLLIEMRGVPYLQQQQIARRLQKSVPRMKHMSFDAGGNGNFLADSMTSYLGESFVTKMQIGSKQYGELLPKLKAATESDHIRLPASAELLGDFMKIVRKEGVPVLPRTREADGVGYRHGDTVVALMMAYSDSLAGGNVDYQRIKGYRQAMKARRAPATSSGYRL